MLGPCKPNRPFLSKIAFGHGVPHGNREQTWSVRVNKGLANVCRGVRSTGEGPMGNPVPHCDLSHRSVFILLRRVSPGSLLTCDYQVIWVRVYGGGVALGGQWLWPLTPMPSTEAMGHMADISKLSLAV